MRLTFSVIVLAAALACSSHVNAKQKGTKMNKDLEGVDYQGSDKVFKEPEPRKEEEEPLPSEDELRETKYQEYRDEYDEKSNNATKSIFEDGEEFGISWNLDANIEEEMKDIDTLKFVYVTDSVNAIPKDETEQDWRMLDLMFYKTLTELKGGYVKTYAYDCQWDGATNFEWEEFKERHGCNNDPYQPFFSLQKSPDVKTNPYTGKRMDDVIVPFGSNELTEQKIKGWFTNNLPDYTQQLKSEVDAEQFDGEDGINKVYLFSSKKVTPPIYQALAANYNNRLRFAVVKKDSPVSESLAAEFKVTKWPTMLINVQKGTEIENIIYEGKLKLPEMNSFVDEYALPKSEAKADYYIASKTQAEMKANSAKQGYRVVDSIDKMKDIILDDMFAGLAYVTEKDQLPHLGIIEDFAEVYGDFINIVVLTLEDAKEAKKEFKGKLPQFRFYRNEVKGQAKRDTSFEILIPDRLKVADADDAKEIYSIIDGEIQDNFEHYVKEVSEKMYYPLARQVTTDEQKHSIAWCYDDDKGATFIFKALSADPFLSQSFSFFAIDSPDSSIVQGESFPALAGMLAITEADPSPRVFSLAGKMISDYFSTVNSLISQLVPEKAEALSQYRNERKGLKKEKPASSSAPREFKEIKNQADFEAVCLNRTACALAILPTILDIDYEAENHKQRLQVMNVISDKAERAASPLHFAWINGTCHREIFNYFDVDPTQIPSVIFYTQAKNKHSTMIGKFDLTTISESADSFMKGGLPVFRPKVDKRDIVIEDKDCSVVQTEVPVEDEGFDDILAEILAEEEAAREEQERLEAESQKAASGKKKGDKKKGDKKKKNKKKKEAAKDEL